MGEFKHEVLSEMVDRELDARRIEAAVDALLEDGELASEWYRAHQLRGLLRDDVDAPFDVRAAVRDEIALHPPTVSVLRPRLRPVAPWPRYVWGGALAATVALLVVAGLRPWQAAPEVPAIAQPATPPSGQWPAVATAGGDEAATQVPAPASPTSTAPGALDRSLDRFGAIYNSNELFAGQGNDALFQNVSVDGRQ